MKISWTSLKISFAGAKLSHLVQKDRIWDHGSMAEQARIIFYLVQKSKANENIESLKKQCTISCFEKLNAGMNEEEKQYAAFVKNPVIKELAVIDVHPGKNKRPDMFTALIKGVSKDEKNDVNEFTAQWSFVRQGEWWILDDMKSKRIFKAE